MCTLHNFHCSKVRFIHKGTVTGLHSCSEKNTHTPRVHLVIKICNNITVYQTFKSYAILHSQMLFTIETCLSSC